MAEKQLNYVEVEKEEVSTEITTPFDPKKIDFSKDE